MEVDGEYGQLIKHHLSKWLINGEYVFSSNGSNGDT